tara:strand:+ start:1578 stop:2435 length:858 start_codon:yes stop_codon:yes gene_type:complete
MKTKNTELVAKYLEHIKSEKKLSDGTITTYTNIGKNLDFSIMLSQKTLIQKLKELYNNPNTLQLYLNMIILIRRYNNEPTDMLVKLRNSLRDDIIKIRKENLSELNDKLPTKSYIIEQLNNMSGIRFVLNYLIIHHALRNKDMNLLIIESEKSMDDENQNYMVINKKKKMIKLVINNYKTEDKYGTKEIKITDSDFYKNVLKLYNEKDSKFLMQLKNGDEIKSISTLNDKILNLTIEKLGQNKLVKIVIKDLINNKSFDKLEQLSRDRGTSLEVLLKSYNLYNGE